MFKDLKGFVGYVDKNDISAYIKKIQKFPILSHEDESRLATEWIKNRSNKAAHALINSHLRLVVKIAMKFRGYGLQLSELVSEGNLGLIQSLERFDPKKDLDFQPMLCGGLEHQSKNIFYTPGHL